MRRLHFAVHLTEFPHPSRWAEDWVWKGQVKTVVRVIYSTIVQRERERERERWLIGVLTLPIGNRVTVFVGAGK